MHTKTGVITTVGGIGAGQSATNTAADAVGSGPEFTVTFTTNPGVLKSIEVDTENILNTGVADYWVANSRQGQFNSRYSTNLGRVNTLKYGSTKLYTNTDLTGLVVGATTTTAASLVKVGGQEFQVVGENAAFLTLSEPFLGNSIGATLTATGAELGSSHTYGAHGNIACTNCVSAFDAATNVITNAPGTGDLSHASFEGTWIKLTSAAANIGVRSEAQISAGTLQKTCQGKILSSTGTSTTLAPGHNCISFTLADVSFTVAKGMFVPAVTTGAASTHKAAEISVAGVDTDIVVQHLQSGAALSVGGCSF